MTVSEKVIHLLSDEGCGVIPIDGIQVESLLHDLGFDSLRYMELVVLLEETFQITFPDEMLEVTSDTSVKDMVETVRTCIDHLV